MPLKAQRHFLLPDSSTVIKEIPKQKGGILPAVDLASEKNPTPDMIANGKKLYNSTCSSCHGEDGKGDGPAAAALNPKPRNYHQTDGWTNGRTIDAMYKTVQEGVPNTGMTAFEFIPPKDRFDIIQYIRTFADFPPITDKQLSDLDQTYNLSKGTVKPNTIPVELAIEKITEENSSENKEIDGIVKQIGGETETGAVLLKHNTVNEEKAVKSFIASGSAGSFDKFVKTVSSDPVNLGFKAEVLDLSVNDWKTMYDYLNKLVSRNAG